MDRLPRPSMCMGDCVLPSQYNSDSFMDDLVTWRHFQLFLDEMRALTTSAFLLVGQVDTVRYCCQAWSIYVVELMCWAYLFCVSRLRVRM